MLHILPRLLSIFHSFLPDVFWLIRNKFQLANLIAYFCSNCLSAIFLSADKLQKKKKNKKLIMIFAPVERFLVCEFYSIPQDTFWVIMIQFLKATLGSVYDEKPAIFLKKNIWGKNSICVDMIPKISNLNALFCECTLREQTIFFYSNLMN